MDPPTLRAGSGLLALLGILLAAPARGGPAEDVSGLRGVYAKKAT